MLNKTAGLPQCRGSVKWRKECNTCSCERGTAVCTEKACPGECMQLCPAVYIPVCGSDGKTYSNYCFLSIAMCEDPSISFLHNGPCQETPTIPPLPPPCFLGKPPRGLCNRGQKFFHNIYTRQCEQFLHTSCEDHPNVYDSEKECRRTCPGKNRIKVFSILEYILKKRTNECPQRE